MNIVQNPQLFCTDRSVERVLVLDFTLHLLSAGKFLEPKHSFGVVSGLYIKYKVSCDYVCFLGAHASWKTFNSGHVKPYL